MNPAAPKYGTAAAVCGMFEPPISRVTLWRRVKKTDFPKPIPFPSTNQDAKKKTGPLYWDMTEVGRYFERLKAQRDQQQPA